MYSKEKVLVVVVTHNNPILLQHVFESYEKYDPGYACDFLIVDNSSTDEKHLYQLEKLIYKHRLLTAPNDRVEASFDLAWSENKDYKYYFFVHDDACANKNNWLKVFVDRMESGYVEDIVKNTHLAGYPIGRVGASTQFWRNYDSIISPYNQSVQCRFLKDVLSVMYPNQVPLIFKYSDNDRVLVSNECLSATNGIFNVSRFVTEQQQRPERFQLMCDALNKWLAYPDEGVHPKEKYPPGQCWNKLLLLSEFMTSIETLMNEFRVVGLNGDGFLEQIHGYDQLWSHEYVHHYGSPNFKQSIAKAMNTDAGEVSKMLNNKIFLMKCDSIVQKYFK